MPFVIFAAIFLGCAMLGAVFWRGAYLEKLPLLPGETILYEEHGIHFEALGRRGPSYYPMATVRVTNQRIITSQRPLFARRSHQLHHVIYYTGAEPFAAPGSYLKQALKKGYKTFAITKQQIHFDTQKGAPVIRIHPTESPDDGPIAPCLVSIFPKNIENFRRALQI